MPQQTPDDIHSDFVRILQEFQKEVIPMLRENLTIQGYHYTNNLYNNIALYLNEPQPDQWEIILRLPEYGKYLDKKRPFAAYAKAEDLAKWVTAQGLHNFESIPGYDRGNAIPANAASRIAWAIIGSKPKIPNRFRSFNDPFQWQWFYRPFYGMFGNKKDAMLKAYFEKVPDSVVREVRKTYQDSVKALARV